MAIVVHDQCVPDGFGIQPRPGGTERPQADGYIEDTIGAGSQRREAGNWFVRTGAAPSGCAAGQPQQAEPAQEAPAIHRRSRRPLYCHASGYSRASRPGKPPHARRRIGRIQDPPSPKWAGRNFFFVIGPETRGGREADVGAEIGEAEAFALDETFDLGLAALLAGRLLAVGFRLRRRLRRFARKLHIPSLTGWARLPIREVARVW
jgi:hypothetical protein